MDKDLLREATANLRAMNIDASEEAKSEQAEDARNATLLETVGALEFTATKEEKEEMD